MRPFSCSYFGPNALARHQHLGSEEENREYCARDRNHECSKQCFVNRRVFQCPQKQYNDRYARKSGPNGAEQDRAVEYNRTVVQTGEFWSQAHRFKVLSVPRGTAEVIDAICQPFDDDCRARFGGVLRHMLT
jgi:hypothetical protein